MTIIEEIEARYHANPQYGIQFSIESSSYECDKEVEFIRNRKSMQAGCIYNWQDIILDGKEIGFLEEVVSGKLFDPITVSFYIPVEDEKITPAMRESPHFYEEECCFMRFATLQQMVNYICST